MGAATAIELAALDSEVDITAGLVARDHLDPGPEQLVEHGWIKLHLRAGTDAPDRQFFREHVRPRLRRCGVPDRADALRAVERAQPVETQGLETRPLAAPERGERDRRVYDSDRAAILRRRCIKIIRGEQTAGTGHALDDHVRPSGEVPADMFRQQAGIFTEAAGDPGADHDAESLAFTRVDVVLRPTRRA